MRLSQTLNIIMKNIFFHQFLDLKNVAKKKLKQSIIIIKWKYI